jgi:hypothetical protein
MSADQCQYPARDRVHSDDRVTVYCGRPQPVFLCGFHALQQTLGTPILAAVPRALPESGDTGTS